MNIHQFTEYASRKIEEARRDIAAALVLGQAKDIEEYRRQVGKAAGLAAAAVILKEAAAKIEGDEDG